MLACESLDIRVAGRCLLRSLTASFGPGRLVAMLGRNGVGKTLTLHTLAGLRAADAGAVTLDGQPLGRWPRRVLARRLSLLPQSAEDPFPTTVIETALIGRHPHLGFWQWEGPAEHALARQALAEMDLAGLESRELDTLSGGERRRLAVAALLTQDPGICLLDEPTNHLDPPHQLAVLERFRRRVDEGGTVIASLHDATLAARFADDALLLFGDGRWQFGEFARVVTPATLGELYGSPVAELAWQGRRVFVGA